MRTRPTRPLEPDGARATATPPPRRPHAALADSPRGAAEEKGSWHGPRGGAQACASGAEGPAGETTLVA